MPEIKTEFLFAIAHPSVKIRDFGWHDPTK